MNNTIYFIGTQETRTRLSAGLTPLGFTLADFRGDYPRNRETLILYELEHLETLAFPIPDNLILVTSNPALAGEANPHLFHIRTGSEEELGYRFSLFLLEFLRRKTEEPRTPIACTGRLYVLEEDPVADELLDRLTEGTGQPWKQMPFPGTGDAPAAREALFLPHDPGRLEWICRNLKELDGLTLLLYRFPRKTKKELRNFRSLIPMIFLSGTGRFRLRRACRALS